MFEGIDMFLYDLMRKSKIEKMKARRWTSLVGLTLLPQASAKQALWLPNTFGSSMVLQVSVVTNEIYCKREK